MPITQRTALALFGVLFGASLTQQDGFASSFLFAQQFGTSSSLGSAAGAWLCGQPQPPARQDNRGRFSRIMTSSAAAKNSHLENALTPLLPLLQFSYS
jgi:hypothetical protein